MFQSTLAFYLTVICAWASAELSLTNNESFEFENNISKAADETAPSHRNITTTIDKKPNEFRKANMTATSQSIQYTQTEAKAKDVTKYRNKKMPSRRFISWFSKMMGNRPTTTPIPTYTTSFTEKPHFHASTNSHALMMRYLIDVLQNLTRVIDKLDSDIEIQNSLNPIMSSLHHDRQSERFPTVRRGKREAPANDSVSSDDTSEVSYVTNATVTPTPAISTTLLPTTLTTSQDGLESNPCTPNNATRRTYRESNPAVKNKLLGYLNATFLEIDSKIQPVQQIKKIYANDYVFRIGYIVANVDTLEVSILNLKRDMDKHKSQWEDKKILDLFDKIMVSNKVVTSLIESLNEMQQKNLL